jgi:hypothetical protein
VKSRPVSLQSLAADALEDEILAAVERIATRIDAAPIGRYLQGSPAFLRSDEVVRSAAEEIAAVLFEHMENRSATGADIARLWGEEES